MTKVTLLNQLKDFTEHSVDGILLPVAPQKGDDGKPQMRVPEVHCARLPDSKSAKKKAPYILHQILNGRDIQPSGNRATSVAIVRSIFCVFDNDEQQGGLALLEVMERLRIDLLETEVIGGQFHLDLEAGIESVVYPEDTAPYYAGEMITTWKLPIIERKIQNVKGKHWSGSGLQ